MSFGDAMRKRADLLRKRGVDAGKAFERASVTATRAAIDAATEKTPPVGKARGTDMITGELKAHWETDSQKEPTVSYESGATEVETVLANNMQYASYVNNGHRMDKHFVPGLILNPYTDQLERSPDGSGGIVVGTKTQYVPGVFMREAGIEAFEDTAKRELLEIAREALHD